MFSLLTRSSTTLRFVTLPILRPSRPFRTSIAPQMGRRSAKIATRKNKADAIRAKTLGKFGKRIIQVAKAGGADPVANSKLNDLLRQAKDAGVPKDVIDRNLKKAGEAKQADFLELTYEAYGPGGSGFVIEVLTDNVNRSAAEVKGAITKGGGKPAEPGSVMFSFVRQGLLVVENTSEDAVFEAAMEAGADDIQPADDEEDGTPSTSYRVYTAVEDFAAAASSLRAAGFAINGEASQLVHRGTAEVEVDDEAFAKCEALMDRLLELDDVDAVYTNVTGLGS